MFKEKERGRFSFFMVSYSYQGAPCLAISNTTFHALPVQARRSQLVCYRSIYMVLRLIALECVAEMTRRPLLSLTVADIGTDESKMENALSEWFDRAARWEAILLIDEADIFLEKRSFSHLMRNSLVSGIYDCLNQSSFSYAQLTFSSLPENHGIL
jgi:hypothetical protein